MHTTCQNRKIKAQHGVVCSLPDDFFGYFGWPSITRMDDGTLVAAASGMRSQHICPFGRSIVCMSQDDGQTWTSPAVINDSPLDDRDTGILAMGGKNLLLSWFSTDTRKSNIIDRYRDKDDPELIKRYESGLRRMTDANAAHWLGSWVRVSSDCGETWNDPIKVELTAPHGPIRLKSGSLLHFGKEFLTDMAGFTTGSGGISAALSGDNGNTWKRLGMVPLYPGTVEQNYHEPHVVEIAEGKLLGLIRIENKRESQDLEKLGLEHFSMMQTESLDGGTTWSQAVPLGFHGCPPHLLLHSSGAIVCTYGYRNPPYGERAMISRDTGQSWEYHFILRDDGPDRDLGYPSTVELADGSLFTMYYQKTASSDEKCSLLWTHWDLPI